VVKTRWNEVHQVGEKINTSLGQNEDELYGEGLEDIFDVEEKVADKDGEGGQKIMSYGAPFKSAWFMADAASLNDNL